MQDFHASARDAELRRGGTPWNLDLMLLIWMELALMF